MSSGSPTAYLLWAILAVLFQIFLISHLWCYDRFKCVLWNSGRQPGAFKRVMTYCYLGTIPALVFFGVAMTDLKFKEGYMVYDDVIAPRPYELWTPRHRTWVLPLLFVFSAAWAFELVTHLEELTFWLFLLHQGPSRRDWFTSGEFRLWYTGSVAAVIGMPLVTLVSRHDLESCEAWIFLAGSCAGTATTLVFLYVLWKFPGFLRYVKGEGAQPDVVVRLATFYHLNLIRVCFRFIFTLPLLILAIDGVQGAHPVLSNPFGSDFLLMLAAIGCFVSTAITLLIFFPRALAKDSDCAPPPPPNHHPPPPASLPKSACPPSHYNPQHQPHPPTGSYFPFPNAQPYSPGSEIMLDAAGVHYRSRSRSRAGGKGREGGEGGVVMVDGKGVGVDGGKGMGMGVDGAKYVDGDRGESRVTVLEAATPPPPSYRMHSGVVAVSGSGSGAGAGAGLHPYVTTFTSPIDLPDVPDDGLPRAI